MPVTESGGMRRMFVVRRHGAADAGAAGTQGMSFLDDDFAYFDTTRWSKGDHWLGRSYLDPANVDVRGKNLRVRVPARTLQGGEIFFNDLHGYGSYSARIKLPYAPTKTRLVR